MHLQGKLGKQNYYQKAEEIYGPLTDAIKNNSQNKTKTITETSMTSNKEIENLNTKPLEIMIDRGILAFFLMSPLSKITNTKNTSQFRPVKNSTSNRVFNLLIQSSIPITLHDNFSTFRDSDKVFELKGDLLKMITNKTYNVDLASLQDKKKFVCKRNEF